MSLVSLTDDDNDNSGNDGCLLNFFLRLCYGSSYFTLLITPISNMKKLRHREVKCLAQGHIPTEKHR